MNDTELKLFLTENKVIVYTKNVAPKGARTLLLNVPSGVHFEVDVIRKSHGKIRSFQLFSATAFSLWFGEGQPVGMSAYPTMTQYSYNGDPANMYLYQDSGSAINVELILWGGDL